MKVRETHISWVFLAGELAYELKEPLVLDFVDYSTAEKRDEMSREEVRLNRRLASDLYLGVRGVVLTDDGVQLVEQDDSRADDLLVEMRRYDERDTIAARLERGELAREQIAEVGRVLARFHANARRVPVDRAPLLAGGQRFGDELVTAYRDAGVDSGGDQLIAFYATYRALARAKIAIVRAAQLESDGTELEIFRRSVPTEPPRSMACSSSRSAPIAADTTGCWRACSGPHRTASATTSRTSPIPSAVATISPRR